MATTKITRGKSFSAAVRYDLENGLNKSDRAKIAELPATEAQGLIAGFEEGKRARLLATNLIEGDNSELAEQFEKVARQRPGIKEPVHKVAISIKPGEHLETHQWLEVGRSYLEEMGYKDCPFLIAQHREKDHEHIHILTSRIDFNGDAVSDSFDKKRARKWAQKIEEKYDLCRTEEKASEKGLTRAEIEQSMKTGKIPARIFLQETVNQTLEKYQETFEFVKALEKQNISVMVRTKADREIAGISFGYDDKYFKGSNLGANFTWNKLQERGLNYDSQRDYGKLEEASQRASRGMLEFSETGQSAVKRHIVISAVAGIGGTGTESIAENLDVGDGLSESDRFGGQQSGRGENQRTRNSGGGTEKTTGSEYSAVQSVSDAAAENQQLASERDSELARGNETELRRAWRDDQGNAQTARRTEPENQAFEDLAAEEADPNFAVPLIEFEFDGLDEYFRELEERSRISELLGQTTSGDPNAQTIIAGGGLSAETAQRATGTETDAGAGISALDDNTGYDSRSDKLDDQNVPSGSMGDNPILLLAVDDGAGNYGRNNFSNDSHSSDSNSVLRDSGSVSGTGGSDSWNVKENLSQSLRESLYEAKKTMEETIEIQDRLEEVEAVEKQKAEERELEIEFDMDMGMGRGRSM